MSHLARTRQPVEGRAARQAARREELLGAARDAIRVHGPAVSMEVIAARAGITKPIVYKHFGDRRGLARALAEDFVTGLMADLARSLQRDAHPRELLSTTIDAYLAFVERDPQVYRFLVNEALAGNAEPTDALAGVMDQIARQVSLVLSAQLRAGGLDAGPAEPWAHGIVGMVHHAGDWWVERHPIPRDQLSEYLTALLWDGMAGWGGRGEPGPSPVDSAVGG